MNGVLEPEAPVVIIGAGQAGLSAAAKLREMDHKGPITLIGDEPERSEGFLRSCLFYTAYMGIS